MESFHYSQPEVISDEIQQAISRIRSTIGLELTLIEKVALRKIVTECCTMADKDISAYDEIMPHIEATAIFMSVYYETPFVTLDDITSIVEIRYSIFKKTGFDRVSEFFKKKQEGGTPTITNCYNSYQRIQSSLAWLILLKTYQYDRPRIHERSSQRSAQSLQKRRVCS